MLDLFHVRSITSITFIYSSRSIFANNIEVQLKNNWIEPRNFLSHFSYSMPMCKTTKNLVAVNAVDRRVTTPMFKLYSHVPFPTDVWDLFVLFVGQLSFCFQFCVKCGANSYRSSSEYRTNISLQATWPIKFALGSNISLNESEKKLILYPKTKHLKETPSL